MHLWKLTSAVALACASLAADAAAAEGAPYRGRVSVKPRSYEGAGPARETSATPPRPAPVTAVLVGPAPAPIKALADADGMTPLSSEDLAGAMGDGATRTLGIDGKAHDHVLKIGGRTGEDATARIEDSAVTRLTPMPPPAAPEGMNILGGPGVGGLGITIIQSHGF